MAKARPVAKETDLERLAQLSEEVAADYVDQSASEWETSPFAWIRELPSSRTKGKVGESLVKAWAKLEGIEVRPPTDSGHDCILDGVLVEVKFSLRWAGGEFVFQQIRDQSYEVAALLGIEPHSCSSLDRPQERAMGPCCGSTRRGWRKGHKVASVPSG